MFVAQKQRGQAGAFQKASAGDLQLIGRGQGIICRIAGGERGF
jgi:hypothetical protein